MVIGFSNITGTFGIPQIGLYSGTCNSLTPAGCDISGAPTTFTGIVAGQTYYVQVSGNGACTATESFTISLTSIPVISNPGVQTTCDSYTLGTFSGTNIFTPTYWTQTGGQGTQLNIGDVISTSSTVYIYDQNGTCTSEEAFDITIIQTPSITNPGNQSACATYSLPAIAGSNLSGSQGFFNNSQAQVGTALSGAITSSQTVFMYDANGACSKSFSDRFL